MPFEVKAHHEKAIANRNTLDTKHAKMSHINDQALTQWHI